MKTIILSVMLTAALIFGMSFTNTFPKAWADSSSLGSAVPAAADIVTIFDASAGTNIGVNWSFLSRNLLQGVNWVGLNTTTGAVNWNYIGS